MKILALFLLLPLHIFSQNLTGIWTGTIQTTDKKLPYEVVISDTDGKLTGYSYTVFTVAGKEEIGVKSIKVKSEKEKILLEDEALLFNDYQSTGPREIRQFCTLSLQYGADSAMILNGTFKTNKTRELRSVTGSISLRKRNPLLQTRIIPKLEEMGLSSSLSFLQDPPKAPVVEVAEVVPTVEKVKPALQEIKQTAITAPTTIRQAGSAIQPNATAMIPPPVIEKTPAEEPKPKEVAVVTPPPVVKKSPPVVPAKEVPKQIVVVPKQAVVKKAIPAVVPAAKPVVKASVPPVVKTTPSELPGASAADITKRTTEMIESVYFKSDSLLLSLYDNGGVDGDTVSVLLNGRVIIASQGLSTNAIRQTIYMTPDLGDSLQLVMYAENLGSIPPNTGILILQDGNDRYEIRFAGDFKKNSAISLRRRKL